LGAGGVTGCAALAVGEGLARTGITDSSLALFVAGSCVSLPPMMTFISLVAATLVAFEVKWTPSSGPRQVLLIAMQYSKDKAYCVDVARKEKVLLRDCCTVQKAMRRQQ